MNTTWTIEKTAHGESLILRADKLEWVRYELPLTSHSGGQSEFFALESLTESSALFQKIADAFSEATAHEILVAKSQLQHQTLFTDHTAFYNAIRHFLSTIPEQNAIEIPANYQSHQPETLPLTIAALAEFGLILHENSRFNYTLFDKVSNALLFDVVFENAAQIVVTKNPRGLIFAASKNVYLINRSGEIPKVLNPFTGLPLQAPIGRAEFGKIYLHESAFDILFSVDRADRNIGEFLLRVDFNGIVIGKRTIVPQ